MLSPGASPPANIPLDGETPSRATSLASRRFGTVRVPPLRLVVSLMALGASSGLHPRNCLLQYRVHKAPSPCPALPGLVGGGHEEVDFNLIPSSVEPIHQLIVLMHGHALV